MINTFIVFSLLGIAHFFAMFMHILDEKSNVIVHSLCVCLPTYNLPLHCLLALYTLKSGFVLVAVSFEFNLKSPFDEKRIFLVCIRNSKALLNTDCLLLVFYVSKCHANCLVVSLYKGKEINENVALEYSRTSRPVFKCFLLP